jgi:hypothetical protein
VVAARAMLECRQVRHVCRREPANTASPALGSPCCVAKPTIAGWCSGVTVVTSSAWGLPARGIQGGLHVVGRGNRHR